MSARAVGTTATGLAIALGAVLVAGPAMAAQPSGAGRFVGSTGDVDAAIQVTGDGKAITSAPVASYVKESDLADTPCGERRYLPLLRRGRRERVDRTGRFSISRRVGEVTLRAHGRFLSPYTARLAFRVRPAAAFRCGPRALVLHKKGEPQFTGCRSQHATTLLENDDARIFNQRKVLFGYYFLPVAYGCLFSVDKRFRLGLDVPGGGPSGDSSSADASDFQLAGPYTAYVLSYFGAVIGSDEVDVVDLRDGTRVVPGWDGTRVTTPGLGAPSVVRSLVLRDNGSVAWVQNGYYSKEEEVWAHDALGDRKLDSAPEREKSPPIRSLSLTGSTLSWLHDGEPRSATLY